MEEIKRFYYEIAQLRVCIQGDMAESIDKYDNFSAFRSEESEKNELDVDIYTNSEVTAIKDLVNGKIQVEFTIEGSDYIFAANEDMFVFELVDSSKERIIVNNKRGRNEVYISACSDQPMTNFAIWTAFTLVTLQLGGVLAIHASSIIHDNYATLFLGESGTGKSTHSGLWLEHIPQTSLLNDDSPFIRVINNKVYAYGTPWSGKTACYKNEKYEVKAFVRIKQAPQNIIKKYDILNAFGAVYPSCPPTYAYDQELSDITMDTLSFILEKTPIYTLSCRPDKEAALTCYNKVYGRE